MPRDITIGNHGTVNLAASDVMTVNFTHGGTVEIINYGPGKVWLSWTSGRLPAVDAEDSLLLPAMVSYTHNLGRRDPGADVQVIADADTVIAFAQE